MSLNGLDRPDVQDAYDSAIAEAGGWFFLKYVTRDSVDLLGCGKAGVHEARAVVARYTDPSPLYGLIVYRRRKVLIKLVPENTSRLLLARTAVHFQDVVEKYSPYEALLEISSSEALTDTQLAASFPMHTATPSISSNRLDEITEDGEDSAPSALNTGSYFAPQRHRVPSRTPTVSSPAAESSQSPSISNVKPPMSSLLMRNASGQPSITSLASESLASTAADAASEASEREAYSSLSTLDAADGDTSMARPINADVATTQSTMSEADTTIDVTEARPSTSSAVRQTSTASSIQTSARPSTSAQTGYEDDLFDFLKPKQKLGPRPVAATDRTKRPTVAPVSSMPATYRYSMRKADPVHPPSRGLGAPPTPAPLRALPSPPPIPDAPEYKPRPLSRGSVKSLPSHKSATMTPDKLRLMKAVELRKRQLRKSNPHAAQFVPPNEEQITAMPIVPALSPTKEETALDLSSTGQELPVAEEREPSRVDPEASLGKDQMTSYKADSGIELDDNKAEKQESKRDLEEPVNEEQKTEAADMESAMSPVGNITIAEDRVDQVVPVAVSEDLQQLPQDRAAESQPALTTEPPALLSEQTSPISAMPEAPPSSTSPDSNVNEAESDSVRASEISRENSTVSDVRLPQAIDNVDGPQTAPSETPRDMPEIETTSEVRPTTPAAGAGDAMVQSGDQSSTDDLEVYEMRPKWKNSDLARRRQGIIEPIRVDSDADSLSDEALIDELQSATVQQATPVMVSTASPIQEHFSRPLRPSVTSSSVEAPTIPLDQMEARTSSVIAAEKAEEVPAVHTQEMEPPPIPPRAARPPVVIGELPIELKRNVSSEISKRIQALATTTNRDSSRESSRDSSPVFNSRTRSDENGLTRPTRSPIHSRTNSYRAFIRGTAKVIQQPPARFSPATGPTQLAQPVWTVQRDPVTNRESVSVTARIVRPSAGDSVASSKTVENGATPSPTPTTSQQGLSSNPPTPQRTDTGPNSPSSSQQAPTSLSPPLSRTSRDTARAPSAASQHQQPAIPSPTMDDFPPPPRSAYGIDPWNKRSSVSTMNDENAVLNVPKEGSRTSRFFKRMSVIGSKRRSGMQQVSEGSALSAAIANAGAPPASKEIEVHTLMPAPVVVGHLNIQFPDSLLWKRRIVAIDDAGYIKFTLPSQSGPSQQLANSRLPPARRFLLSEFTVPYVPDVDRQELPNSIMLDFLDASNTLQIACEDPVTLVRVSHVLKTYWRAWTKAPAASSFGA